MWETSMHGSFDNQPQGHKISDRTWSVKLVALPVLVAVALIGMAVSHPSITKWISDALQAEHAGSDFVTDGVPTQLAQPKSMRRASTDN
jgi:hypothetical protein